MRERLEGLEGRQDSVNVGKLSLSTINTSTHEGSSSFHNIFTVEEKYYPQ